MTALVIDASVTVKLGVLESDSARARAIVARDVRLIAPEIVIAEVANALWKKELKGEATAALRPVALASALGALDEIIPMGELADRALDLAVALAHPVYDCFYLVLAEERAATFVTADGRLLARLAQSGWAGRFEAL